MIDLAIHTEVKTCDKQAILGDFPKIDGLGCDTYASYLSCSGFFFGLLFFLPLFFLLRKR
jgi:hypothetical protein